MLSGFILALRSGGIQVSLREYLTLLEALDSSAAEPSVDQFHPLARACLVKDETKFDRYDQIFGAYFAGLETIDVAALVENTAIPDEWLRKLTQLDLSDAEKAQIEALGGFDKLMETLKQRLAEQQGRHQGGNKWIGTGGRSPFGAYGYNPEGVRIGQHESRHRRAVKVWDRRDFKDYADDEALSPRAMKLALRHLRQWARDGEADEFDLNGTIESSAQHGYLDVKTRPTRRNAVKVLLFLDVGGSMDDYVQEIAELFSAARHTFKSLDYFYFHNCLYEYVWKDNHRRWDAKSQTLDILNTYDKSYRCIFVGDASMSPYEVSHVGGANEHWNQIAGADWLHTVRQTWPKSIWINPTPKSHWGYTQSISMIHQLFDGRMYPLTLHGLKDGMTALK